jgi:hypothetical protein
MTQDVILKKRGKRISAVSGYRRIFSSPMGPDHRAIFEKACDIARILLFPDPLPGQTVKQPN